MPSNDNNNETAETKFEFEEDAVSTGRSSLTGLVIGDRGNGADSLRGWGGLVRSSSEHLEAVSKFEFEAIETETPGRGVSTVFICLYTAIGLILPYPKFRHI